MFFGKETAADEEALSQVRISFREESKAGADALQQLLMHYKQRGATVTQDSKDAKYVGRLVDELRPLMNNARRYRRIHVWIIETDDTDARSFPGGHIVVFRGLIDFCESEAALVGILGHELSHIDRGHQLYHLRRFKLAQQSVSSGFDPRRMMSMGSMMAKMFMRPFRPEEETEADQDGARWAFQLQYDSSEMARVFLKLSQRDRGRPAFMPSFLRSHPFHEDRYAAILRQTDEMKAKRHDARLYVGRQNLETRLTRTEKQFE
jgi:predicted Zn-dependent protease